MSKYKLKNEYQDLLKEEIVSILRKKNNFVDELWDIEFDKNDSIIDANKKKEIPELLKLLLQIKPNYASLSDAKIVAHYLENEENAQNIYRISTTNLSKEQMLNHLNTYFTDLARYTKDRIGKGELSFHLAFETTNWNTTAEPDAITENYRISVKSVEDSYERARGAAKTGESAETGKVNRINQRITDEAMPFWNGIEERVVAGRPIKPFVVSRLLKEHYGIKVSETAIRNHFTNLVDNAEE